MRSARSAAVLTWVYAAGFGLPTIPVSIYLLQRGRLPTFWGLFEMYGGPWSAQLFNQSLVLRLNAFLVVTVVAAWSGWLIWKGLRTGAILNLGLLPVEALFWIGFALPFPWLSGVARTVLLVYAWRSLGWPRNQMATPE
jgi:hypothetical protein